MRYVSQLTCTSPHHTYAAIADLNQIKFSDIREASYTYMDQSLDNEGLDYDVQGRRLVLEAQAREADRIRRQLPTHSDRATVLALVDEDSTDHFKRSIADRLWMTEAEVNNATREQAQKKAGKHMRTVKDRIEKCGKRYSKP